MVKTINKENIKQYIDLLEWKPLSTDIIISLNETVDNDEFSLNSSAIKTSQFILAVGSMVREIKEGDEVYLDLDKLVETIRDVRNFDAPIQKIKVFPITLSDGTEVGCVSSNTVKFIKK